MHWIDLVIVSTIVLLALIGLRSGLLAPVGGLGGLALGIVLAFQYSALLADALVPYVHDATVRQITAFLAIVVGTALTARVLTALIRRLLSHLFLGWIDRVGGAIAGVALGVVALGTAMYLVQGVDNPRLRQPIEASQLASTISRASLISSPSPWCFAAREVSLSAIQQDLQDGELPQFTERPAAGCTDLRTLALGFINGRVSLGQDVETLAGVVEASLSGDTEELIRLTQNQQ